MNTSLKSMAYAFRAEDFEIFTSEDENCFIALHLVCSKCKAFWYTDLAECYLCGEINYGVTVCDKNHYSSQQDNVNQCKKCGEVAEKKCINAKCPSNTSGIIKDICEKKRDPGKRGVFERGESSFRTSQLHCVECGGGGYMYNQFLIYIENYDEETWKKKAEEHHEKLDDVIIFKKKFQMLKQEKDGQNKEYTCFKGSDDIEEWAPKWNGKLSEVIKEIFK